MQFRWSRIDLNSQAHTIENAIICCHQLTAWGLKSIEYYLILEEWLDRLVERFTVFVVVHWYSGDAGFYYAAGAGARCCRATAGIVTGGRHFQRVSHGMIAVRLLVGGEGWFERCFLLLAFRGVLCAFKQIVSFSFLLQLIFAVFWSLFTEKDVVLLTKFNQLLTW